MTHAPGRLTSAERPYPFMLGANRVNDAVVHVNTLASVSPKSGDNVVGHYSTVDVSVIDVGDLQLSPPTRTQIPHNLKDVRTVHVDADDSVLTRWILGLFADIRKLI